MDKILIYKIGKFYTMNDIYKIRDNKPDALIFDDDFVSSINNFYLPNSILYMDFGDKFNKSLDGIIFPKYLKKLILSKSFDKSLDYVCIPENLEVLIIGEKYNQFLFSINLPKSLREFTINNLHYNYAIPIKHVENLEKLCINYIQDKKYVNLSVAKKLKYFRIHVSDYEALFLEFQELFESLETLELIGCITYDLINLPCQLKKLYFNTLSFKQPPYYNLETITEYQTNLPLNLEEIILSDISAYSKFKKIPFGCIITDSKGNIITNET